ncbi:penicillin-binding transpeptidase domain-containing protein [Streptomyces sp. AK02-01A]|uniref:penicillin-binding transpeptidase domain-containing protein n=1 Tax=Streptomyces sp. AK02-01A TaxID=3028648 RepID=UPI0029B204AB|nr:penicillin-binding transpeptidase domain-containing protein [Streptomyces sp. AK02-01A]MDX3849263.1 penicillin-binding transpeptidase domain-containing protein [Streptomyces sp. AK02-01A]
MRSGARSVIVGGVLVVVTGGIGYGGYSVWERVTHTIPSGPLSGPEIEKASTEFLNRWAAGDKPADIAELTDNAAEAAPVIAAFREQAHASHVVIAQGRATGATVPFTVKATVSFDGKSEPWSYRSELTVVRGPLTGRPVVDWQPSVIHPKLTQDTHLVTGRAKIPSIRAVDRDGTELTRAKYPSLAPILDQLRQRYGVKAGGTPGIEMSLRHDSPDVPDRPLLTLSQGTPGTVPTTLDAGVQAAAEQAVHRFEESSVVAVKPSTGEILAVANNRKDGFNAAMLGKQAPGSTMKIVTAAMLMEKGLAAPELPAECPETVVYQGRKFHNDGGFAIPSGSLAEAFARSCNTAFIKLIDDTKDDGALKTEAEQVFGVGRDNWKTGVVSADGSVPAAVGGEAAAQYIGQGTVQMNALNMASISATVKSGVFRQPVIVPQSLDNRPLAEAGRPLARSVAESLRYLMRLTATGGTAAKAMAELGGDKGAKTGSAEVDGQTISNSWFTGYEDDLAAAAVVQAGGHGADEAGPVVAAVLEAG